MNEWVKELPLAITVCNTEGKILEMNDKSAFTFSKYGGLELIGADLLNCHPEPARSLLAEMLVDPRMNAYTIEKEGVKKLIYQTPWYKDGVYAGFVELSLIIPMEMKHFIRG